MYAWQSKDNFVESHYSFFMFLLSFSHGAQIQQSRIWFRPRHWPTGCKCHCEAKSRPCFPGACTRVMLEQQLWPGPPSHQVSPTSHYPNTPAHHPSSAPASPSPSSCPTGTPTGSCLVLIIVDHSCQQLLSSSTPLLTYTSSPTILDLVISPFYSFHDLYQMGNCSEISLVF